MLTRIVSAVIGFALLLVFVIIGGIPMEIAMTITSIIGMYELYMAVSKKLKPVHFLGFAAEIYYVFIFNRFNFEGALFNGHKVGIMWYINQYAVLLAVVVMLIMLVAMYESIDIHDVAITVFGFLYVGVLMYCLVQLHQIKKALIWLPLICAWGSDTCAYFVGVKFGKHKLAPVLSPKKSIEGSIGGIVGAGILVSLYCYICRRLGLIAYNASEIMFFIIGSVAAALSQIGDLAASAIKRQMNIKDYGKIMPGHGGILDRFDSVLLTAPTVYILVSSFIILGD